MFLKDLYVALLTGVLLALVFIAFATATDIMSQPEQPQANTTKMDINLQLKFDEAGKLVASDVKTQLPNIGARIPVQVQSYGIIENELRNQVAVLEKENKALKEKSKNCQ